MNERQQAASAACQGLVIAKCLREALQDCVTKKNEGNVGDENGFLDQSAANRVMQTFGEAVLDTPWNEAPGVLLKGRLDHFNRVGGNWRFVSDELEMAPRLPLLAGKQKRPFRSLWHVDEKKQKRIKIDGSLQILAHGDN